MAVRANRIARNARGAWITAALALLLAACGSPPPDEGSVLDGLGSLQQSRVYPHADLAERALRNGDAAAATAHWRAALEAAPHHAPLVRALVDSLLAERDYAEALHVLASHPELPGHGPLRHTARMGWLADEATQPVAPWQSWLDDADPGEADEIVRAFAARAEASGAFDSAQQELGRVVCPGNGCAESLRARAILAERAGSPERVVAALQTLREHQTLRPEDRRRAAAALVQLQRWDALHTELSGLPQDQVATLLREAVQRAIGSGQWEHAEALLAELEQHDRLSLAEREQRLVILQELERWPQAADAARDLGECLLAVELALQGGLGATARRWLDTCARAPEARWLESALAAQALQALAQARLSDATLEQRRITGLAFLLESRGDDAALLEVLARQPGPVAEEYRLQALQRLSRHGEAAAIHERRYRDRGELAELERATFLHLQADQTEQAARLLLDAAPFDDDAPGHGLSYRLLNLYPLPGLDPELSIPQAMATRSADPALRLAAVDVLQLAGRCESVRSLLANERSAAAHLRLGFCHQETAPGLAAHHFRHALEGGLDEAREPLAVMLGVSGDWEAALPLWQALDERDELTDSSRRMYVETALASGRTTLARTQWLRLQPSEDAQWWSLRARIAQSEAREEEALEAWEQAHRHEPSAASAYQLAVLQDRRGNPDEALQRWHEAHQREPDSAAYLAALGYAQLSAGQPGAEDTFRRALDLEPWRFELYEQLGFLYAQDRRDAEAALAFRHAIDRLRPELPPPGLSREQTERRRYVAQRAHESLTRRWRLSANAWAASGSVPGEFLFDRDPPRNAAEVALDRRLGERSALGSLHLMGRILAHGGTSSPLSHRGAALGLDWRLPIGISTVGVDWFTPQHGSGEWLLRAATQFLGDADRSGDWRPARDRWLEERLFLGGAWWTRSDQYLASARYDRAWHHAVSSRHAISWFPYLAGEARRIREGHDVRAGAGIGARLWTGAGDYDAHRRAHTLRLELQHAPSTNIADRNGLFVRLESSW